MGFIDNNRIVGVQIPVGLRFGQQNAVELGNAVLQDWIGLPFTAFVDASGQITHVHVGELHREQASEFLKELL